VEFGTHDVLMAKNGSYSNLVNAQMKREIDENEELVESDEEIRKYESNENILTTEFINTTAPLAMLEKKQKSSIKVTNYTNNFFFTFDYFLQCILEFRSRATLWS